MFVSQQLSNKFVYRHFHYANEPTGITFYFPGSLVQLYNKENIIKTEKKNPRKINKNLSKRIDRTNSSSVSKHFLSLTRLLIKTNYIIQICLSITFTSIDIIVLISTRSILNPNKYTCSIS